MRWAGRRQSSNIEDRRGFSGGAVIGGGGCLTIVVVIAALLFGVDPRALLPELGTEAPPAGEVGRETNPAEDQLKQFSSVVLADTEDVWHQLFRNQLNRTYQEPQLVLFTGSNRSGCGFASSQMGPFYCPQDQKIYLDLQFFEDLTRRYRAAGDFAQAYVIAHEVGHHIQNQLGTLQRVHSRRERANSTESNQLSVRLELQADFLAGVWAHHTQKTKEVLEPGDIDEALRAANAIGDDRLQKQAQGYVVPDSFTHGTSEQRARWFRLGFETGDLSRLMDPFNLPYGQL